MKKLFPISKNKMFGLSIFYFCICVVGSLLSLSVETRHVSTALCGAAFIFCIVLGFLLIIETETRLKKGVGESSLKKIPLWAIRYSKILKTWLIVTFLLSLIDFWKSGFFPIPISKASVRVLLLAYALLLYGHFHFIHRNYFFR